MSKLDLTIVTNYLVDKGEFVDESILSVLKDIFSKNLSSEELKSSLIIFFKKNFPDLVYSDFIIKHFSQKIIPSNVTILKSFEKTPTKRSFQDFVKYFNVRFKKLELMLRNRSELKGLTSISRVKLKSGRENVSVIGMILEKNITKNGHVMLSLEDLSGVIKVLINKDNKDLIEEAKDLSLDEVIGVVGTGNADIIFANSIIHPDIPLSKELKKSPFDHYVVFFGDLHIGSKEFLHKEFYRLLLWLNGKLGTLQQREIARKVRYIIIPGDIVEGVGIYPGQEDDLDLKSVRDQYSFAAKLFKKIPSYIKIIISPGNHDVGRIAEPQLPIDREYADDLWNLDNVIMVSNPALVSLDKTEDFSGITVLVYHGYSLIYYSDAIPSIRSRGGQKVCDDIMVYLLKRRHLAPTHGSTLYIPDPNEDALVIDEIPDIFLSGHIHRAQTKNYRNVTCINSSSWTAITEDQEKRGLEPQPARAFAISLKTREVKLMNFSSIKDTSTVAEYKRLKAEQEQKKNSSSLNT